ncbi:hypothetical protein [Zunongwangia profunda]|uniref:hypothetical protein n=1 Tax=Zunongwangia profunda TaxID=398743 RepID=UPI001D18102A|nr:hypothetical protein [Zunongwangia profunda]MCC4228381.1 hypothetical protein [Zunongwangia profunda]
MSNLYEHNHIHFGTGTQAAYVFSGKNKDNHTIAPIEETAGAGGKIAKWGDDNEYPKRFLEVVKKNGAAGSSYRFNRAAHYGQGFRLIKPTETKNGKEDRQIVSLNSVPEIREFFRRNKIHRVFTEIITDLETFDLGWPEYILTNDFSKIYSLKRLQTAKMRFEKINPKTGIIENSYFCHNWKSSTATDSEYVSKIPVIDNYCSAEEVKEYCKRNKVHKFTMPIYYPLIDETYYPEPSHHSVFRNGWMEVVNAIPEYKKHFSENQLNVKYMVYISDEYFTRTYADEWEKFDTNKKLEIRKNLKDAIDAHLAGNKNAGKSIQTTVFKDREGKWVKGIEVVPLKDENSSEGKGLLDSSVGNSEIMSAIGVDPNLMGVGIPGGKLNGGSGSDKREAFSILNSLFKTKRETTLDIWRLLRDYNGWDENLEGDFAVTNLTTLDKNPTGTQNEI